MKKRKLEKIFLEELAKIPNISVACERVNLSRQTIYRWMKEDKKFKKRIDLAMYMGTESICDLAESKLIGNIKTGSQRAIEYVLNHKRYKVIKENIERNSSRAEKAKLNEPLIWEVRDYREKE